MKREGGSPPAPGKPAAHADAQPHADRLDVRTHQERLRPKQIRAIARKLDRIHSSKRSRAAKTPETAEPSLSERSHAGFARLATAIDIPAPSLELLNDRQSRELDQHRATLAARREPPVARVLHGDLLADRVWVDAKRRVTFAPATTGRLGDPAEDLSLLCADLRSRGAGAVAEKLLAEYVHRRDDFELLIVLAFYERVRAAEEAVRVAARAPERARALSEVVLSAGATPGLPPALIAVAGPVASGKSTLAQKIARRAGVPRVIADRVREIVSESWKRDDAPSPLEWHGNIEERFDERAYRALRARASSTLASGRSVVIDACLPTRSARDRMAQVAASHGVPFVFVECRPSREEVDSRLLHRDRRDGCEPGSWRVLANRVDASWEARSDDEPGIALRLDTGRSSASCLADVCAAVPEWPDGSLG